MASSACLISAPGQSGQCSFLNPVLPSFLFSQDRHIGAEFVSQAVGLAVFRKGTLTSYSSQDMYNISPWFLVRPALLTQLFPEDSICSWPRLFWMHGFHLHWSCLGWASNLTSTGGMKYPGNTQIQQSCAKFIH